MIDNKRNIRLKLLWICGLMVLDGSASLTYNYLKEHPNREKMNEQYYEQDELTKEDIKNYFNNLSDYPLLADTTCFDKKMEEYLYDVCINNPYINLEDMQKRITITDVHYHKNYRNNNENDHTLGMTSYHINSQDVDIYRINSYSDIYKTYFHELIHALFPQISDCTFFEEAITDCMTEECYYPVSSGYSFHRDLLKLWIETLGTDVFKEMRATGSIDPFKDALLHLDYDVDEINHMILTLNDYQLLYMINKNSISISKLRGRYQDILNTNGTINQRVLDDYLKSGRKQLIRDVKRAYECQYHRSFEHNPIVNCYLKSMEEECNHKNPETKKVYEYHASYFVGKKPSTKIIVREESGTITDQQTLSRDDYNLKENQPKCYAK